MKLLHDGAALRVARVLQGTEQTRRIRQRVMSSTSPSALKRSAARAARARHGRADSVHHRIRTPRPVRSVFGESPGVTAILLAITILLGLLLLRPMLMSLISYHRTASLLSDRRTEVAALKQRNTELRARVTYFGTDAFIAERAREYGLVHPGETSYVVRELVHPELLTKYAQAQLQNASHRASRTATPASSAG